MVQKLSRLILSAMFIIGVFTVVSFVNTPQALANAPAPNPTTAKFEVGFMERLSDHHLSAVKADTLCLQRATHQALLNLCASDKKSQQMEINELVSWLKQWYGVSYQPRLTVAGRALVSYLDSVHNSKAFEIAYMEAIMPHHMQAILMAQNCLQRAYHEQLKELCSNTISAQRMEMNEMKGFLCTWYDICNK